MKNIMISALITWLIHATGFIVDCTTFQYIATLFLFAVCSYALLAWVDDATRQNKRRTARPPVRRFQSINFEGTRI